jgi:hypothetical protein
MITAIWVGTRFEVEELEGSDVSIKWREILKIIIDIAELDVQGSA